MGFVSHATVRETIPDVSPNCIIFPVPLRGFPIVQPPDPFAKSRQVNPAKYMPVIRQDYPSVNGATGHLLETLQEGIRELAQANRI